LDAEPGMLNKNRAEDDPLRGFVYGIVHREQRERYAKQ
jgi:hypothetical protein